MRVFRSIHTEEASTASQLPRHRDQVDVAVSQREIGGPTEKAAKGRQGIVVESLDL